MLFNEMGSPLRHRHEHGVWNQAFPFHCFPKEWDYNTGGWVDTPMSSTVFSPPISNYGNVNKGHRANGFTTDGGFKQYAVNNINTLIKVPDSMTDEEATLVVTAGTTMYGLTELGGLIAGESLVVLGPGPIGLLGVAVAKALGAGPVILIGTRDSRLEIGKRLGADYTLNVKNEKDIVQSVKKIFQQENGLSFL